MEEQLLEHVCLSFRKVSFSPYHRNVSVGAQSDTAPEQVRGLDRSSAVVPIRLDTQVEFAANMKPASLTLKSNPSPTYLEPGQQHLLLFNLQHLQGFTDSPQKPRALQSGIQPAPLQQLP